VVIVGAGEMGYHLARRLAGEKRNVVCIDRYKARVNFVEENLDVQALVGPGASPRVLKKAGVEKANILVAVTDSDEVNLLACYTAGTMNKFVTKVARLRDDYYSEHPEILDKDHLGIDLVISPETEAVTKLMQVLQVPSASDVVDFAGGRIKLFGIRLTPESPLVGRSLIEIRRDFPDDGILIAVIFRESEVIIPTGKEILRSRDTVYVMASRDAIPRVSEIAGLETQPLNRFMILGGTAAGVKIAQALEGNNINQIQLLESDGDKCEEIAALLHHTMVLKADAVDEEFLASEGIAEIDGFLAMTDDDEHNALTALLAKRMGAKRVAARTNKMEYHKLISAIGVDVVINPRLAAASRILQYIRKGKVISVSMLPGEGAEAIEFEAMETSKLVGTPLSELRFPSGAILGAVVRAKKFFIPHGATVIEPGDRVVVFAKREAIPKVEKLLTVNLRYF
jgi:trk/ktr system potassium uptake protein